MTKIKPNWKLCLENYVRAVVNGEIKHLLRDEVVQDIKDFYPDVSERSIIRHWGNVVNSNSQQLTYHWRKKHSIHARTIK